MRQRSTDAREYFARHGSALDVHAQLLPRAPRPASLQAAAQDLARFVESDHELRKFLRSLPGGALWAVDLLATVGRATEDEAAALLREPLGSEERGREALRGLLGRGLVGVAKVGESSSYLLWPPFVDRVAGCLGGQHLRPAEPTAVGPDRFGFALAAFLGHLARCAPRLTATGRIFAREQTRADALFQRVTGAQGCERLFRACVGLGLAGEEELPGGGGQRVVVDVEAVEAYFALDRATRAAQLLAAGFVEPGLLAALVAAGEAAVPRWRLKWIHHGTRAGAQWYQTSVERSAVEVDEFVGVMHGLGLVDERAGAVRLEPCLSAHLARRAAPPTAEPNGRWHVQPNFEIVVPAEVPPAAVFRLGRSAELLALDRVATYRLGAEQVAAAAAQGLTAAEIRAHVEARAAAVLPDTVARAISDGAAGRSPGEIHQGTFVVVTEAAAPLLRAGPVAQFIRAEVAPGVFLFREGKETAARTALEKAGVGLRRGQAARRRERPAPAALAPAAVTPPEPADVELSALLLAAQRGESSAFPPPPAAAPAAVAAPSQRPAPEAAAGFPARVQRAAGVVSDDPAAWRRLAAVVSPRQRRQLERELEHLRKCPNPEDHFDRWVLDMIIAAGQPLGGELGPRPPALPERAQGGVVRLEPQPRQEHPASIGYTSDWRTVAIQALAERRDVRLRLRDEPERVVTPHRLAERGGEQLLEALRHDSGDLRAFAGSNIKSAALGESSASEHLQAAAKPQPVMQVSRNSPCPCGSGKRYKHCCLPKDMIRSSS